MKIAIIGGRDFCDYELLCNSIKKHILDKNIKIDYIVSGGAKGADSLGERYAKENNIETIIFYPKWNDIMVKDCIVKVNKYGKQYNALAGFNRNKNIVLESDLIIAFWDKQSKGTKDSIDYAKKINKRTITINY